MRADSGDVYVQHLLPDGTIAAGWPKNGLAVCTAPGIQMAPSITSDGAGGAFVSWQDDRSVDGWRAYAQHVLSSGATAPGWSENGVLVCTGPGDHLIPRSAPDEAGGAVVAWQDMRYASTGIYAARLGADGALLAAGPCDAAASVVTTSADSGTVRIVWHVNHPGVVVVLCRQVDGPWMPVRKILTDELGTVDYSDQDAIAGCRYGYALDVSACGAPPQVMGELWIDIPEGAGFAPLSASAQPAVAEAGRVRLSWEIAGGEGLTATVFRRDSCSTWNSLGTADVDDFGVAHFDDQSLFEGHSVDYRLVVHACGRDTSLAESWVEIPSGQGFIPTAAELISAMAGPSDAHLLWQKQSGPSCIARIYRRDSTTSIWTLRGEPEIDVGGAIRFDDLGLEPGMRYEYQLGLWSCGRERLFGPAGVQIPRFDLALRGSWPNPARASLSIPFTLESADPATLELFDVGGRLISRRSVGTLGPGEHVFVLDHPTLAAGLYLIRLTQGGRALTARAVVLR